MAHYVGDSVFFAWPLGAALTGLGGTMTATLYRYPDSTTRTAAGEAVTIGEIGATGYYTFAFVPIYAQLYTLEVAESTLGLSTSFTTDVDTAGAVSTAADAYCSEADVIAWAQMGDYGAATVPTETQVLNFMAMRAAELYGILRSVVGNDAPGPTGYGLTIDTTTDAGTALSYHLRMANAIGAAMDALEAAGTSEQPARSERVAEMASAYSATAQLLGNLVRAYVGFGSVASTHYDEGRVSRGTFTTRTEDGLRFDGTTEW